MATITFPSADTPTTPLDQNTKIFAADDNGDPAVVTGADILSKASQNIIGTLTSTSQSPTGSETTGQSYLVTNATDSDVNYPNFPTADSPHSIYVTASTTGYVTKQSDGNWVYTPQQQNLTGVQMQSTLKADGIAAGLADAAAVVNNSDIDKTGGTELFDNTQVINGKKIDPSTGAILPDASYKISGVIPVQPNTSYDAENLGTVHNALPFRFTDASGNYISLVLSGTDVSSFTFTTPATAAGVQFTVKTAKTGDNMDINTISLKVTGDATVVTGIQGNEIKSNLAVNKSELQYIFNIGKNKFPPIVLAGYYDPSTYAFVSNPLYKATSLIKTSGGATWTVSGLSSAHWALGVAFFQADGITPCSTKGATIPANVTSASFITPADCAFYAYTWHTSNTSDNSTASTQQVELGDTATDYEAPKQGVAAYSNMPFVSQYVANDPVLDSDPVSYGYFKSKVVVTTTGKIVFLFGDSITTTADRTNWPTYAMPLLGITPDKVSNFAIAGAHWEDFTGATTGQQMSEQVANAIASGITPDIIIVAMGTNSFGSANFGSYAATMAKAIGDLDVTNVMDAMRKHLYTLSQQWPNARKYFGVPLQRASMDVDTERGFNNQYVEMANNYNFTIIDAFNESGYLHDFLVNGGASLYSDDGLHPNAVFKPIMGSYYAKRIGATYF